MRGHHLILSFWNINLNMAEGGAFSLAFADDGGFRLELHAFETSQTFFTILDNVLSLSPRDFVLTWSVCLFQERSPTSASGRAAAGASPGQTSWRATTASTPAPSPSSVATATAASRAPTTSHCTWSATSNVTASLPTRRVIFCDRHSPL